MTTKILNDWIPAGTKEIRAPRAEPLRDGAWPQQRAEAERLLRRAHRAHRRVRDALDLALLNAGGCLLLAPHTSDLRAVCEAALEDARATSPGREFAVGHLGDGNGFWDAERLTRALAILLEHAHALAPSGTVVRLRWSAVANDVTILVEREVGEDAPRLGDACGGEHGAEPDELAARIPVRLARQIVLQHGGSFSIVSTPAGASYHVALPRTLSERR